MTPCIRWPKKRQYPSKKQARKALRVWFARRGFEPPPDTRAYNCPFCPFWHVGRWGY